MNDEYNHERALTAERDMSRRLGHSQYELKHVRAGYRNILKLLKQLATVLAEVKRNSDIRVRVASDRGGRSKNEALFFLRESVNELHRLKMEFVHVRARSKEFVQSLINVEQLCVDTQGVVSELCETLNA